MMSMLEGRFSSSSLFFNQIFYYYNKFFQCRALYMGGLLLFPTALKAEPPTMATADTVTSGIVSQSISKNAISQTSLPQAIVDSPAVANIMVTLSLDKASTILETALSIAKTESMLPITVVILDAGGHIVALKRQDGAGIFRVELANAKAYGALGMGVSTRVLGERLQNRPVFAGALTGVSKGKWVDVPGGVLIRNEKAQVIGSVGISGDTSDKDEYAAINAIKAAGYYPEPLEPNENWKGTQL
ncbi:heme-binding protein [uncultured Shewanella sp.]|uniref:GlcG/HbpS family heme-binding protein n=1 Tax=uncultured Shewanella sp. TaxID=173975 RepID=UPI00261670B0|nr:heme-binding protein [uncultured Shewanella sp.]